MKRWGTLLPAALAAILLTATALAAESDTGLRERALALNPTLDGESFSQVAVSSTDGDTAVRFVRDSESFERWTKLIGLRLQQVPGIGNDPERMAAAMIGTLQNTNPDLQFQVSRNDSSGAVMLDFMTWPVDQSFIEFSVFLLQTSQNAEALVSLQLAARFPAFSVADTRMLEQLAALREAWKQQASVFDLTVLAALFE